jgi:hypothetical protein
MQEHIKNLLVGITVATAIAAPACAQSNPPQIPTVPPDLTFSCDSDDDVSHHFASSVQIWKSARVLAWSDIGQPTEIYSAQIGPTQISYSGNYHDTGTINRITGRWFYRVGSQSMRGTCVPATPPKL